MAKTKPFTPAVGFFKEGGKTRPITQRKQSKLRIVRRQDTGRGLVGISIFLVIWLVKGTFILRSI